MRKFAQIHLHPWQMVGLASVLLATTAFFSATVQARDAVRPPGSAVASAHPEATKAGISILKAGGNAFDAAVAVSAALAVVEPSGSGMGGGGFWLLHRGVDGFETMLDGRERAPLSATANMYLDGDGRYLPRASKDGPLAAGIPGQPAALVHLAEQYGRLPLSQSLAPAIRLAEKGFRVDKRLAKLLGYRRDVIAQSPSAADIFLPNAEPLTRRQRLVQTDLAATLRALASQGREGFYGGAVAQALVDGVRAAGGIWTLEDLQQYTVVERDPIDFTYRDWRVVSAALPSSGGVVMAQAMKMLASDDLPNLETEQRSHLVIEAWRRAYEDRARYLGDPDMVSMPLERLTSDAYAARKRRSIDSRLASKSNKYQRLISGEGRDTSHFSIIDSEGNMVAATLSINFPFGSGFMAPNTGVLLNNEMDDFSAQPGQPNGYGLVGSRANAIAPGKRMLSSMSPTFAFGPDRIAVLGTPGGSRIISMVMLGLLDAMDGHDAKAIVSAPRFHHQYLPDEVQHEPDAFSTSMLDGLARRGHKLRDVGRHYGNMQAIIWDRDARRLDAASDPRGVGRAMTLRRPSRPRSRH